MAKVLCGAKSLPKDGILEVSVAFRLIPLIDTLQQQGYATFCRETSDASIELFVSVVLAE